MSIDLDALDVLAARVNTSTLKSWQKLVDHLRAFPDEIVEPRAAVAGEEQSLKSNLRELLVRQSRTLAKLLLPIADAFETNAEAASAFRARASEQETRVNGKSMTGTRRDVREARGVARGISWSAPRGKYDAYAMPNGDLVLENAKGVQILVERGMVRRVLALDTGDANGTSMTQVALTAPGVENGKSKLTTLCATFRAKDRIVIEGGLVGVGAEGDERSASRTFFDFMRAAYGDDACGTTNPSKTFAGTKGMGHVQATKGFNSGHLFFLDEGVAFGPSPAMYVHFDDLEDLRVLRADGAGSSSFDLSMTPENGTAIEFTNISREELEHVSRYLAKRCTSADDDPSAADLLDAAEDEDDDSDDEDDEDFTGRERESDDDTDEDDDDDNEGNDMEYSHDDSDEARGEEDEDSDSDNVAPRSDRKRPRASEAEARDYSESDSESDDNAFQVVRG